MKKGTSENSNRYVKSNRVLNVTFEPGKRFQWLSDIIKKRGYTCGAEIGCAGGTTTRQLLRNCRRLHLYTVDLWGIPGVGSGQYDHWNFDRIYKKFLTQTRFFKTRITVLRGISWEMAERVEDNSLDFIFIDADHAYESVVKDIQAWTPKLKLEGMISGHDTHFVGVLKAINELIPEWKAAGMDHVWYARKEDVLC